MKWTLSNYRHHPALNAYGIETKKGGKTYYRKAFVILKFDPIEDDDFRDLIALANRKHKDEQTTAFTYEEFVLQCWDRLLLQRVSSNGNFPDLDATTSDASILNPNSDPNVERLNTFFLFCTRGSGDKKQSLYASEKMKKGPAFEPVEWWNLPRPVAYSLLRRPVRNALERFLRQVVIGKNQARKDGDASIPAESELLKTYTIEKLFGWSSFGELSAPRPKKKTALEAFDELQLVI